jgi:hypothetical protein
MGLKFVQFYKNTSWHTGIDQSPYQALFGVTPRIGLTSSNLHPDILNKLVTEDDLLSVFDSTGEVQDKAEAARPPSQALQGICF